MPEDRAEALEGIARAVRRCTRCRLCRGRTHAVPGEGPVGADLFLIGEAPGRDEDASGRPFVGSAGKVLDAALAAARLPRDAVFITNVVKCRPPGNRPPRTDEIEACRRFLRGELAAVRPKMLVTLGSTALQVLLGPRPKLHEARGKIWSFEDIPVLPTYHPAGVLYQRSLEPVLRNDLRKAARFIQVPGGRIRSGRPRPGRTARKHRSCGAVLIKPDGRVLILRKRRDGTWCLPKGTMEPGETAEETAIREVHEETGFRVKLIQPLAEVRYSFYWPPDRMNIDKRVTYFLAEPVGGRLNPEPEFDAARWVTRAQAMRLLRWPNDRHVVARAFYASQLRRPNAGSRGPSPAARRSSHRSS